jgi:ribosomal protein S18 acetylase RimI-like enzyme
VKPPLTVRRAVIADASTLAELGASTFTETFAEANTPEDFATYMAASFSEALQRMELEDANNTVFLAEREGEAIGYIRVREGRTPSCIAAEDALEIARLYARKSTLGTGVGATLMQHALAEAAGRGKDAVWLGVWEHNARAIRFYEQWDFHPAGTQPFLLGTDLQTDLVMVRRIARES